MTQGVSLKPQHGNALDIARRHMHMVEMTHYAHFLPRIPLGTWKTIQPRSKHALATWDSIVLLPVPRAP